MLSRLNAENTACPAAEPDLRSQRRDRDAWSRSWVQEYGEGAGAGGARGQRESEQIESVSAPLYSRWGFHNAQLPSRSLFTILPLKL